MNKLFSKVAALSVGLAMAIGVGVAVGSRSEARVQAAGTDATQYSLINSTSSLEAGKSYIITSGTSGSVKAISTTSNNNNRPATSATVSGGKITRGSSIMSVTLEASGSNWKIKTENYAGTAGYFSQGNQTSNNYLKVVASGDDFTISFSGDAAIITSKLKTSRNVMKFNSSSNLFACYSSNSTVDGPVYLWREAGAATSFTVTYDGNGSTSGTVPVDSKTYSSGDKATVLGNTGNLEKTGYTFMGWTYNSNTYQAGDKVDITSSVTLTAKWYKNDSVEPKEASFDVFNTASLVLTTCVTADGDGALSFTVPSNDYYSYNAETLTLTADSTKTGGPATITAHKGSASCTFEINVVKLPAVVSLANPGANFGTSESASLQTATVADEFTSINYTLNYVQCKKQTDGTSTGIFMKKNVSPFISNHTEMPNEIESIKVYTCSGAAAATSYDVAFGTSEFTTATAGIGAYVIGKGSSHVYENTSVSGAKYFCITLGNANNGQVLKIEVYYKDSSKKDMTIYTSDSPAQGTSWYWSGTADVYQFVAKEDSVALTDVSWSVNDETVATINASTGRLTCVKPGDVTVFAEKDGYNKASAAISIIKGSLKEIAISGAMTQTAYITGESWNHAGLVATATYHSGWQEDVASSAEWTYEPAAPAVGVTSVVATATLEEIAGESSAQAVTVTRANPIQALYTKAKGAASGEFYGYYVGFLPGSGPVVMDGEYGILLYNYSQDVSEWTEGETILHITSGTIDIYSGLYEVKNYAVEVVASADVDTPILHTTTGNEVANQASRITNATGFVATSPSKGNFTDPAGTSDIQFTFTVGSKTFTVFYKKASQEDSVIAKLADSLANQTEITLKGFTSWFNSFQVQMNGLIEAVVTYTAEDFSQDLLTQTDNICKNYVDGESSYSEFKALLTAVWSNLAGADKYPSLPSDQKTILAEAERVESGTVVERAMARYDFLTGKYDLNNFINGRTPVQAFNGSLAINETTDNNTMIIIITIAAVSAFAFTSLLVIKKKKHN